MAEKATMFTAGPLRSYVITIVATATPVLTLLATQLAADGFKPEDVSQVILMEKVTAGTDRAAVLVGHSAAQMNMYYGAGIPVDPPSRGDWFVKRAGGSDVTATAYLAMA